MTIFATFSLFFVDSAVSAVYFGVMNTEADDGSPLGLLAELGLLCETHGVPVVGGALTQYPPGAMVIECDARGFTKTSGEKAIELAQPSVVVIHIDVTDSAVVGRAWLVGPSMVFFWDCRDNNESDDLLDDEDGDEDASRDQLAELARRLADDPTFRRASNAAEREHVAHQWLPGVGFTPAPSELREIARMAQVVWEFEIMPGEVAALVAGGATPADIAAQLGIGMTKAKRMVAQAKIG